MRTEYVTESVSKTLDLSNNEAQALRSIGARLASKSIWWGEPVDVEFPERTVVSCEPTAAGQHSVVVRNAIGVIRVDGLQIEVRPKIPPEHLLFLAEESDLMPRLDEQRANLLDGTNLWELMANWYTARLGEVLHADLIKDYRSQIDELPAASGRVLVMPTTRSYYAGRLRMTCEYELFDEDSPVNRVLKAAAVAVARSPAGSTMIRQKARRLLLAMHDVGDLQSGDLAAPTDQRATHYRDAHILARQILGATIKNPQHGAGLGWAFLLPTPPLVEAGLRKSLARRLAPHHLSSKGGSKKITGTNLHLRPDLVFNRGAAVGDVKYKLHDGKWLRGDLYQVTTYAVAWQADRASIISFDNCTHGTTAPDLDIGGIKVRTLTWPCNGTLSPGKACDALAEKCVQWLTDK